MFAVQSESVKLSTDDTMKKIKKRILIIEDNSTMMIGLRDNFLHAGFDVFTEMDGESGLAAAIDDSPDIILLDIMLPKMNGYDICHSLREVGLRMPILMLTAKGQEEDIIRGLTLGADDYITKPFRIRELIARVHAFLRRSTHSEPDVAFGPFKFNIHSKRLLLDATDVPLTPKERGLLLLFLDRNGKALTRETILSIVWHQNMFVTARSVDRCVNTLRKKIEKDPKQPRYLRSVRDIGYRFDINPNI